MSTQEYIELESEDRMPRIGFGTWQVSFKLQIIIIRICLRTSLNL